MICVTSNQKWPIDLIHKNLLILYATFSLFLTLSIAFPIFEIPPCSSLCSVANFETVSFTFLDDWFRRCNCKGDTSSSLLAVNTNDTLL